MQSSIFREYDIRGIADEEFNEQDVEQIGRGVGTYLLRSGSANAVVGRDCRLTSDRYVDALTRGLLATGCDVIDIGVCPTPVGYFAIHHLNAGGGVMVTASHNPPEYNGFKLSRGKQSIHGKEILAIRDLIEAKDFLTGAGTRSSADVIPDYIRQVTGDIHLSRPLRVGVDAGNGTAGVIAVPVLEALGCEVHPLYCDMDGRFPHHEADPTVRANMQDLIELVKSKQLDAGIGFDGDGDRIGVVDETGEIIYGDLLMLLFSREILSRKPGATFISEVKCSQVLYDDIEKNGGRAIMWKTGHSVIKDKMRIEQAELAGEMSGHMFFSDRYFGFDDATYAACRLLEILSAADTPLSGLLTDVPNTFTTPEIRVESPDAIKFDVVEKAVAYFKETHDVIDIDGARILFEQGWGLVRASNTQPALVLRFEASTPELLEKYRRLVETALEEIQKN
ncbi:MAG: phosphomannomutase [Deltaproteobacteria bacterium]|nr:MAG: phosphomannomutase [Deltaproteobacteria bacterium]